MGALLIYIIIAGIVGGIVCGVLGIEADSGGGTFVMLLCLFGLPVGALIKGAIESAESSAAYKEQARKEQITKDLEAFLDKYKAIEANAKEVTASSAKISLSSLNTEIISCVKQLKNELSDINMRLTAFSSQMHRLLMCSNLLSDEAKLSELKGRSEELDILSGQITALKTERMRKYIVLQETDGQPTKKIRNAFAKLNNSKKKTDESGEPLSVLLGAAKPKDYSYFSVPVEPVFIQMGSFIFGLLPSVILVFDLAGSFVSACSPKELRIRVQRCRESVMIMSNRYNSNKVDSDSKCLEVGTTHSTWQHTRVTGGPDLRYSHNPRIEYRTDTMEYGKVTITIAGMKAEYHFSSSAAIEALEESGEIYCQEPVMIQNPVPSLMNLLSLVSESSQTVASLNAAYSRTGKTQQSFCFIERG